MKTINRSVFSALIMMALATACFSQSPKAEVATKFETMNLPSKNIAYGNLDEIKKDYSALNCEWLEFLCGDKKYVVCLITLPSYGSSSHSCRGWVSAANESKWESFLDYRIRELGAGKLEYSHKDTQLRLKGSANNKYSDVTVLMLDLR